MLIDFLFWLTAGILISPFYSSYLIPAKHRGKRLTTGSRGSKFYKNYHDMYTYNNRQDFIHAEKALTIKAIKFSCTLTFIIFLAEQLW